MNLRNNFRKAQIVGDGACKRTAAEGKMALHSLHRRPTPVPSSLPVEVNRLEHAGATNLRVGSCAHGSWHIFCLRAGPNVVFVLGGVALFRSS
jgi:hypothetical protein